MVVVAFVDTEFLAAVGKEVDSKSGGVDWAMMAVSGAAAGWSSG